MMVQDKYRDAGQSLVVFAVALVGLLVIVGLAVDGGMVYFQRRRAQNAADAAAKEGARQLYGWQMYAVYPDNQTGETKVLEAICRMAERNGVADTDGSPGNHVNGNVTAYYVDSGGNRLGTGDTPLGEAGASDLCSGNRCRPDGSGRCCGVEVKVETEFDTYLIHLTGPVTAPVEAVGAGVFIVSDAYGGVGDSAAYALGTGCDNDQLYMSGDYAQVVGTAHSNDGVHISGDAPSVDHLEYVDTNSRIGEETTVGSLDILPAPVDPNLPFNLAFYRDYAQQNGTFHSGDWNISSSQNGVHYINGNVRIDVASVSLSGVYVVEGDFDALGDDFALNDATIVATGHIQIRSNSAPISPWSDDPWGLSLYSALDNPTCDCSSGYGISLRGDHGTTPGVFYAPKSRVCISANENDIAGGGVFGDAIDVRGDGWIMLPWRPQGGGVGELERITLVR